MKKLKIIVLICFVLIGKGCKDNTTEPPTPPETKYEPLIPISEGNYWLYRGYTLMSESYEGGSPDLDRWGFIIRKLPPQPATKLDSSNYVMNICGDKLTLVDDSKFNPVGGNHLVYRDNKGFYYTGKIKSDSLAISFKDLIFPYPVTKGTSVRGHVFYYSNVGNYANVPDDAHSTYTCLSTDSLFSTPAGDFRCIVYKATIEDMPPLYRKDVYYFIKPGLGIVGMVTKTYRYSTKEYIYFMKVLLTDYKIVGESK
jgi:hypothetical protein